MVSVLLGLITTISGTASAIPTKDVEVCVQVVMQSGTPEATTGSKSTPKPASAVPNPPTEGTVSSGEIPPAADPSVAGDAPTAPPVQNSPALLGPRVNVVHSSPTERYATPEDGVPRGDSGPTRDIRGQNGASLPLGQTPDIYLKRLMEHFVTHEPGFVASQSKCDQTIVVELYPLQTGWTAFARYSGTGREERVDQLLPSELSPFSERSVLALLHDKPIGDTVDRDNVLWSDSLKSTQRIRGRSSVVLGVGTRLRAGVLPTAEGGKVSRKFRLFSPMALQVGYRGQFDSYGVDAGAELDIGTSATAASRNPTGGHVDYGGSAGIVLHVLRYTNPRAVTSTYVGAGSTFALHWFNSIRPASSNASDPRSTLFAGGLDVDLLAGYEFMRASAVSFYLQGELTLPAYVVKNQNDDGSVNTWFPGAALRLGASF